MPTLIIDGQRIEVERGVKVIDAAEQLGIMIPRFCYHKALGAVGACRMCGVKFLDGPLEGIHMSCMVDAVDGMIISTTDPEAMEFRKYVIEWLMLHHPHDCPVCDEGGHCLLQDYTVSGGHGLRRYPGKKRTYRDQYLGYLVRHEMNRCIHCYRCVRYYQEYSGYRDLGTFQIGSRVFFGRFADGALESPFAGNLIDICPTGVYLDITSKYRVRRWDMERGASVCIHCSLGCSTVAGARYREILRQEGRLNEQVNGYFICDRGRFGFQYESHENRPRTARIDGVETEINQAINTAAKKIDDIIQNIGPEAVACLGSSRSSLETQAMLDDFCRRKNIHKPVYFLNDSIAKKVKDAVSRLDLQLALSMKDIEKADFILALGVDAINEAPMLALAMRQAARNGAKVAVADPRPINLPLEFEHFALLPENLKSFLFAVIKDTIKIKSELNIDEFKLKSNVYDFLKALTEGLSFDQDMLDRIKVLAEMLQQSRKPAFICGTQVVTESLPDAVADVAQLFSETKEKSGLFYVFPAANSFGAAVWNNSEKRSFEDILKEIEQGRIKALIVVESNPLYYFPDRKRLVDAIKKLEILLVLDYLPSPTVNRANMFIPSQTIFESGGSYINQEGRIQYANPIHRVGIPVYQHSQGSHPPRIYGLGIPGNDPMPSWEILARISGKISADTAATESLKHFENIRHPSFNLLPEKDYPFDNISVLPQKSRVEPFSRSLKKDLIPVGNLIKLLLVDWTFGTEVLSAFSEPTCKVESPPVVYMHPVDAKLAETAEAEKIHLSLPGGSLEVRLELKENMARRIIVLPRHRRLEWQKCNSYDEWMAVYQTIYPAE
jgi:NADH-quinone oxidoreductase subunit G